MAAITIYVAARVGFPSKVATIDKQPKNKLAEVMALGICLSTRIILCKVNRLIRFMKLGI
jgi:hypothetical protein